MTASPIARQSPQPPRPPGADTRDRHLNPRETDLSLGLTVDPKDVPDVPPVEPDEVLEAFRIKKGFRLELGGRPVTSTTRCDLTHEEK